MHHKLPSRHRETILHRSSLLPSGKPKIESVISLRGNVEKMTNWKGQKDEKNAANHPSLESFYRRIPFTERRYYPKIGNTIYLEGYVWIITYWKWQKESIAWLKNVKLSQNKLWRKSVKSVKGEKKPEDKRKYPKVEKKVEKRQRTGKNLRRGAHWRKKWKLGRAISAKILKARNRKLIKKQDPLETQKL